MPIKINAIFYDYTIRVSLPGADEVNTVARPLAVYSFVDASGELLIDRAIVVLPANFSLNDVNLSIRADINQKKSAMQAQLQTESDRLQLTAEKIRTLSP